MKTSSVETTREGIAAGAIKYCAVFMWLFLLVGCGSGTFLMPTPNAYTHPEWNPFADVPPALQGNKMSILYITDRVAEIDLPDRSVYGFKRSRSAAFGACEVEVGGNHTWEELVKISRTALRTKPLLLSVVSTRELGRFAPTPQSLVIADAELANPALAQDTGDGPVEKKFLEELKARLAKTPRKEVFFYIHGYNNTFNDGMVRQASTWHFLGREGVPIVYSWPCGLGNLRGYEYTLTSTEFTIYHLKQALRLIASCPEVQKIHIISHSRGTAVASDALRELHLETRGTENAVKALKLGTLILAAADIDVDVMIQRNANERIGRAVERVVYYVSREDKALNFSSWLFGEVLRVGEMDTGQLTKEEIETLRQSQRVQVVEANVSFLGNLNHDYYHSNPAVSSDFLLLLRYQFAPGAENGRPLSRSKTGAWSVYDGYPGAGWTLPKR